MLSRLLHAQTLSVASRAWRLPTTRSFSTTILTKESAPASSSSPARDIYPGLTPKLNDGIHPGGLGHNYKLQHMTSYGLLGLLPLGLAGVNPGGAVDLALAAVIPLHFHIGMSQVITDYVHHEGAFKALMGFLSLVTLGTAGALVSLSVSDVGFTGVIRALWGDQTVSKEKK